MCHQCVCVLVIILGSHKLDANAWSFWGISPQWWNDSVGNMMNVVLLVRVPTPVDIDGNSLGTSGYLNCCHCQMLNFCRLLTIHFTQIEIRKIIWTKLPSTSMTLRSSCSFSRVYWRYFSEMVSEYPKDFQGRQNPSMSHAYASLINTSL